MAALAVTVLSAIGAKELSVLHPPLAAAMVMAELEPVAASAPAVVEASAIEPEPTAPAAPEPVVEEILATEETPEETPALEIPPELLRYATDPNIRWFNGRPIRPSKKMWMTITGYSPDARSCGDSADGITATLHSVDTNRMKLVAADPRILAYGSMLSIPGYDNGNAVPVLDCGGAIKGHRLDLLFPTHEQARKWGRKRMLITVWEYADGKPAENPRKMR